jgi:hypothetical protein
MAKKIVGAEDIHRDLSILASVYSARWLRILGGEPLLHPDLLEVIRAAKESGIADRIAVVTNGVILPRLASSLWREIDAMELSLYPGHELGTDEVRECRRAAEAHNVDLRVIRVREFRESYSELGSTNEAMTQRIFDTCHQAHIWRCHTVANGCFYKCPQSYFLGKLVHGSEGAPNGLTLQPAKDLRERLLAYLQSREPLASCTNCLGTAGRRFAHTQSKRGEFRAHQTRSTEDLIDRRYLSRRRFAYTHVRLKLAAVALRLPALRAAHRLK